MKQHVRIAVATVGVAVGLCLAHAASALERPITTPATTTPATTNPATTNPATTTVPQPIAIPTTTPLPQPVPPPDDPDATEPVVQLGSIAIPAIAIERPLYEGIRLPTFDLGPGHWPGTAMPGQPGNMVIGGHRTSSHRDFRDIDRLKPGDEVTVTDTAGASFTYVVESTEIVGPYSLRVVHQTSERTATLFACDPPGSTDRRIVVHLVLVDELPATNA